ncbi:hypothetical protein B0H14DRAFT_1326267 [Mycena olivaceomarginata]|nr:hypothetical protein B0H14DRAFT_1326267 [Mycena olivaceomarginata]
MVYSPPSPSLPTLSCSPLGGRGGGGLNEDLFAYKWSNDPREVMGYDVCVSRVPQDGAAPGLVYLRVVEDYSVMLDGMRDGRVQADNDGEGVEGRVWPLPNAGTLIHLPFPSAPSNFLEWSLHPAALRNSSTSSTTSINSAAMTPGSGLGVYRCAAVSPAALSPSRRRTHVP